MTKLTDKQRLELALDELNKLNDALDDNEITLILVKENEALKEENARLKHLIQLIYKEQHE